MIARFHRTTQRIARPWKAALCLPHALAADTWARNTPGVRAAMHCVGLLRGLPPQRAIDSIDTDTPLTIFARLLVNVQNRVDATHAVAAWFGAAHSASSLVPMLRMLRHEPTLLAAAFKNIRWDQLQPDDATLRALLTLLLPTVLPYPNQLSTRAVEVPARRALTRLLSRSSTPQLAMAAEAVWQHTPDLPGNAVFFELLPWQQLAQHPNTLRAIMTTVLPHAHRYTPLQAKLQSLMDTPQGEAVLAALPPALQMQVARRAPCALGHLDLHAILKLPEAGPLLVGLCWGLREQFIGDGPLDGLAQRRQDGVLWFGLAQLKSALRHYDDPPEGEHPLCVSTPALLLHPDPEQRRQILEGLAKPRGDYSTAHLQRRWRAIAEAYAQGGVSRGTLILQLAQAVLFVPDSPRAQRFFRHRAIARDGRSQQAVLTAMQGIFGVPDGHHLLGRILRQPDDARMEVLLAQHSPNLLDLFHRQRARGQDLLDSPDNKRAVEAFYSQCIVPTLAASLTAYAALARSNPESPLLQGPLMDTPALQDSLCADLISEDQPQHVRGVAHMLNAWRAPSLLFTYAGRLRLHNPDGLQTLQSAVLHAVLGTSDAWRASSMQMQQVLHAAPRFDAQAWSAGASRLLSGKHAGWSIEDTGTLQDIVNSASEGADSCQRVSGSMQFNQCLLGRMADGSKRMLAIKNARGEIVGRAMWRLMLDADKQPVLLLSRPFGGTQMDESTVAEHLATFAKWRAGTLSLRVMSAAPYYDRTGPSRELSSAATREPDYWDEGEPHVSANTMHISNARRLV